MKLGNFTIGLKSDPFVIAEMSGNHNQSLERALEIVDVAAKTGVHALKIQTYTADTMTLNIKDREFLITDPKSPWCGNSLYDLYKKAYTPWEWHKPIFERCRKHNIACFSTPFDTTAVDFLEELDAPFYKIASFENIDHRLIRYVAKTKKPMIISMGMATLQEISEAVSVAQEAGCEQLVLLKCTSSYPAPPESANIAMIPVLRKTFPNCEIGLSDHTLGIGVALAGVALGATVVEKHFTIKRSDGGVDAAFSMEPEEMSSLVEETKRARQSLGEISWGASEEEASSLIFRRSLYVAEDMKAGDVFTEKNLRIIRPGYGLAPKFFDIILGAKVLTDVKKGTAMSWKLIK